MYSVTSTYSSRRNRRISAIGTLLVHAAALVLMSFFVMWKPKEVPLIELDWGGSSGAPNQSISETETNPSKEKESSTASGAVRESKIDVPEMKSSSESVIPPAKQAVKKPGTSVRKKPSSGEASTSRRRRARAGVAGGAGTSTGYSIEWAGSGSRRLLSGRIPVYPEGTDKELPVLLQFSVLPDGSVSSVIPLRKSDELLEREAISALRTWRFDPLPPQFEQKLQTGRITFNFTLER